MIRKGFLIVALTLSGVAAGQQYRWTDEQGAVRYTATPPPKSARNVQTLPAVAPPPAPQVSYEMARLKSEYPVTLYTTSTCGEACDVARDALNLRGIPFREAAVSSPEVHEELKQVAGAVEVPTVIVGREVHRGFEAGAVSAMLDRAGYPRTGILPAGTRKGPDADPAATGTPAAALPPQPAKPAATRGPYDTSGLVGPEPKRGIYDPSGLVGPAPKPGPYDPEKQLK